MTSRNTQGQDHDPDIFKALNVSKAGQNNGLVSVEHV